VLPPRNARAAAADIRPHHDRLGLGPRPGLEYRGVGIIDAVPVLHTRPVGQLRDANLQREVDEESLRLRTQYDCEPRHAVFSAYGPGFEPLGLEGDRLLVAAAAGWDYLFAEKPGLLRSIVAEQAFSPGGRQAAIRPGDVLAAGATFPEPGIRSA
jgi:hypothetical protein